LCCASQKPGELDAWILSHDSPLLAQATALPAGASRSEATPTESQSGSSSVGDKLIRLNGPAGDVTNDAVIESELPLLLEGLMSCDYVANGSVWVCLQVHNHHVHHHYLLLSLKT
jgi:hypothetical protein